MRIIVFACKFQGGAWTNWEHTCDEKEAAAVLNSSQARAFGQGFSRTPTKTSCLQGARYMFDVARGLPHAPAEGDIHVCGVSLGKTMVGQRKSQDRDFHVAVA